ncbi:DsbA family protein, partial [Myxococcus xanthus]|uniref:DsbA family protein n=2 Tax=Myxococcus TaxID=32 RepID=UPI00035DE010
GTKPEELYAKLNAENVANAPTAPAAAPGAPAEPPVQKVDVGNAPVKGDKNAPVTIVAFSDFECPFCSRVVPTLKQLEDQYGGKIKVAFKNQPLPFHANAKLAAAAALAANEQGKFWEYHDKLFANQRALDRASLEKYAQELGLNVDKFKAALDQGKFNAQIEADMAQASSVGASGTPTFFINGRTLVGAQPVDAFKRVIDEELKKLGGAVADSK